MKKRGSAALAIASIAATAAVALAASGAGTGLTGSKHDLNYLSGYTADTLGRSCVFCHTPHNALSDNTDALTPLWNHADNTLTFIPYAWVAPTNKNIPFASDPLIGPSRLCMACHDGSTAVDSHGSAASFQTGNTQMKNVETAHYTDALGNVAKRYITDLNVTHPIGFKYDDAVNARPGELVDKNLGFLTFAPTATFDTHNRPTTYGTYSTKRIRDTLYGELDGNNMGGYMTCATCHDVHNSVNAAPDKGHDYNYFLYAKEEGSAICLSCHIK